MLRHTNMASCRAISICVCCHVKDINTYTNAYRTDEYMHALYSHMRIQNFTHNLRTQIYTIKHRTMLY